MNPTEAEAALMVAVHRAVSEAVASKKPPRGRIHYSYEYGDAAVRAAYRQGMAAGPCRHDWREVLEHIAWVRALREGRYDGGSPGYHTDGNGMCPICVVADKTIVELRRAP